MSKTTILFIVLGSVIATLTVVWLMDGVKGRHTAFEPVEYWLSQPPKGDPQKKPAYFSMVHGTEQGEPVIVILIHVEDPASMPPLEHVLEEHNSPNTVTINGARIYPSDDRPVVYVNKQGVNQWTFYEIDMDDALVRSTFERANEMSYKMMKEFWHNDVEPKLIQEVPTTPSLDPK